jgi:hypothetical protein
MVRALVIACLLAAVLPTAADAAKRSRTIDVARGELIVTYSGSGTMSHSNGVQCVGTDPCFAFGVISFGADWDAMAIADRRGFVGPDDTKLSASAVDDRRPTEGDPMMPPPPPRDCSSTLDDNNGEYGDGTSVTTTAKSVGVQVILPVDSRWLKLKNTTDPKLCGWSDNVSAGAVLGAQSYGPRNDEPAAQKGLARVLAPKLAIRKSDKTVSRKFNFLYHRAPPHTYGPYSLTVINIESTVTVVNHCRRFDETHGRCLKYYG